MVVYKYLKDRNWVFMVRDDTAEVNIQAQQYIHKLFCINAGAHITDTFLFFKDRIIHGNNHTSGSRLTLLILYREGRELMTMERAIRRLGNLELSADKELESFYNSLQNFQIAAVGCLRVKQRLIRMIQIGPVFHICNSASRKSGAVCG